MGRLVVLGGSNVHILSSLMDSCWLVFQLYIVVAVAVCLLKQNTLHVLFNRVRRVMIPMIECR